MVKPQEIKKELLNSCALFVLSRKEKILQSLDSVKKSLYTASKSTSGDKHHTERAMLQIEREKLGNQLLEIEKLERTLSFIQPDKIVDKAQLGSLVITNIGIYFIAVSLGKITQNNKLYYVVSMQSPIGKVLLEKSKNDTFEFNGNKIIVLSIF